MSSSARPAMPSFSLPALLIPAVQVNMRAGILPPAEADGVRYLKLPIDVL